MGSYPHKRKTSSKHETQYVNLQKHQHNTALGGALPQLGLKIMFMAEWLCGKVVWNVGLSVLVVVLSDLPLPPIRHPATTMSLNVCRGITLNIPLCSCEKGELSPMPLKIKIMAEQLWTVGSSMGYWTFTTTAVTMSTVSIALPQLDSFVTPLRFQFDNKKQKKGGVAGREYQRFTQDLK